MGGLEALGAIGLMVPAATGVQPWLTPVAASCLAILMGSRPSITCGGRASARTSF